MAKLTIPSGEIAEHIKFDQNLQSSDYDSSEWENTIPIKNSNLTLGVNLNLNRNTTEIRTEHIFDNKAGLIRISGDLTQSLESLIHWGEVIADGAEGVIRDLNFIEPIEMEVPLCIKQIARYEHPPIPIIDTLCRINHRNICRHYRFLSDASSYCIIMEKIEGLELKEFIKQYCYLNGYTHLPDDLLKSILNQITVAIDVCHRNSIIHRDIKPENFMVKFPSYITSIRDIDKDSIHIVLVDFGLACPSDGQCPKNRVGTAAYMAPEVILGKEYNKAVDIWALGILTLYLVDNHNQCISLSEYFSEESRGKKMLVDIYKNQLSLETTSSCVNMKYHPNKNKLNIDKTIKAGHGKVPSDTYNSQLWSTNVEEFTLARQKALKSHEYQDYAEQLKVTNSATVHYDEPCTKGARVGNMNLAPMSREFTFISSHSKNNEILWSKSRSGSTTTQTGWSLPSDSPQSFNRGVSDYHHSAVSEDDLEAKIYLGIINVDNLPTKVEFQLRRYKLTEGITQLLCHNPEKRVSAAQILHNKIFGLV